jgi:DNA-binding NarL/FixJ family response regulator
MSEQFAEVLEHDAPSYAETPAYPASLARTRPADNVVRVVVGVASPALMFGLGSLIHGMPGVELVATAQSLERLVADCGEAGDCVALVDPDLFGHDTREFMRALRLVAPRARVVLISNTCQPHLIREAIQAGACGYVEKTADAAEIRAAISATMRGQRYLGSRVTNGLAEALMIQNLTAREMDVLKLLARGDCNKIIARELTVTVGTIKTHVRAIMGKLDSRSRTDAVLKAFRLGLVRIC